MPDKECPVLVRGFSRSGGTLMVTILDAHPDIAMSYELYPHLLEEEDRDVLEIANEIEAAPSLPAAAKILGKTKLRVFIARLARGGLDTHDVVELLRQHAAEGHGFDNREESIRFMAACCVRKMEKQGKTAWGLKSTNRYEDYLQAWPEAYFLNMIRDGRDVLASQLRTGSFKNSPGDVGRAWAQTVKRFRELRDIPTTKTYEVRYEVLVSEPEDEVHRVCRFLGIDFDPAMLQFHEQELTIFGASHLSMNRISKPIDTASVGRWKEELSQQQLDDFSSTAGETMTELGYT